MSTTTAPVPATTRQPAPHEVVWALAQAIIPSRAVQVVAELGIADHLGDEPTSTDDLATSCAVNPHALRRVLQLLSAHGLFAVDGARVAHTDASRLLRTDHPASMRAFARLNGLTVLWNAIGALDHALRTGATGVELAEPGGFFAYLDAHPDEAQVFGEAMAAKARADIADVLAAYDFRPFATIADIGGGLGHLLHALLDAAPTAHGVLFDLPDVIATADITSDRIHSQAGDFFADALPPADAYLLMEIIHDWRDEEATAILRAIRRAAQPGATVLIIEHTAPDEGADIVSHTLDVLMLAVTGGRERTAGQLGTLLRSAGFRPSGVVATAGPTRIVEGVAI
jgi:hypothetical protein